MSVQDDKIRKIGRTVIKLRHAEEAAHSSIQLFALRLGRWVTMLAHEFFKDEVKTRAESLSFLMVFSILPLIAGGFFLFNIFAQFGYVQDALVSGVDSLLTNIPNEHRSFVQDYVLRFKDAYLQSLSQKSGSIGIFALFVLVWVGLSTYGNIDSTLNHIWSSHRQRPFFEKFRNFLVVMVLGPIVLISTLSIPLMFQKMDLGIYLSHQLPFIPFLINALLFPSLGLMTFTMIYRFIPVTVVRWKSAIVGAVFALSALQMVNLGMRLYFQYGTNTAYGKAAAVPLVLFWIYLMWMVLILGAEVSYLMQTEVESFEDPENEHSLRDGGNLVSLLLALLEAHRDGHGPLTFFEIKSIGRWSDSRVNRILDYLVAKGWVVRCGGMTDLTGNYVLAKDVAQVPVQNILKDFLGGESRTARRFEGRWKESFLHWLTYFGDQTFAAFLDEKPKKKK